MKYLISFWFIGLFLLLFLIFFQGEKRQKNWESKKALAEHFLLTDYCLSTESRHTRHFTMPEYSAAFQDFPAYYEHFPSSSFFFPIQIIKKRKKVGK
jgi:hypothetical protein